MEWFLAAGCNRRGECIWSRLVPLPLQEASWGLEDYTRDQILQVRHNCPLPDRSSATWIVSNKVVMASSTDDDAKTDNQTLILTHWKWTLRHPNSALAPITRNLGSATKHLIYQMKKPLQNDAGVSFYKNILLSQDIIKCSFFTIAQCLMNCILCCYQRNHSCSTSTWRHFKSVVYH